MYAHTYIHTYIYIYICKGDAETKKPTKATGNNQPTSDKHINTSKPETTNTNITNTRKQKHAQANKQPAQKTTRKVRLKGILHTVGGGSGRRDMPNVQRINPCCPNRHFALSEANRAGDLV